MKGSLIVTIIIVLLQSCAASKQDKKAVAEADAGTGTSKIIGGKSYIDPIGFQATVQTKFVEINSSSSFFGGVGFSHQGAAYKETLVSGKVILDYINLPLRYSYLKNNFYAEAGLQPSFIVNAKDKYNGISHDFKDDVKKFDLGVIAGAGYRLGNGLGFGIRIIPGITNLNNDGDENDHNLLILGLISYRFRGKR